MNVKTLRQGMTVAELAQKLGVHERSVYRWSGGHAKPSPMAKQRLAAVQRVAANVPKDDAPQPPEQPAPGRVKFDLR